MKPLLLCLKRLVVLGALLLVFGVCPRAADAAEEGAERRMADGIFARIDDISISGREFQAVFRSQARQKFYHGQAPEAELAAFRRQIGDFLVNQRLLAREAERRGLQPDAQAVARGMDEATRRFVSSPQWAEHGASILRTVGERLRRENLAAVLEAQVRNVPHPTAAQVQAYYRQHRDKFTTPARVGVSVILLRVSPAATQEQWDRGRIQAEGLADELRQGADFAELARLHSQDPSADEGGDLGFVHRDMLGGGAQEAIDVLRPGESTAPLRMLEGYALFRLNARETAQLNPLSKVRERAAALWRREAGNQAWQYLGDTLRRAAEIQVNEEYLAAGPEESTSNRVNRSRGP